MRPDMFSPVRIGATFLGLLAALAILAVGGCAAMQGKPPAQTSQVGMMDSLYMLPAGVETHWASAENFKGEKGVAGQMNAGRKGSAMFPLQAGEKRVLAEVAGRSGTVRRIWITINDRSPEMLRGIRLDMYWDGADKPAASVPIGDFFGHVIGRMATFESALFSSPEGRSFNCCIPMPFRTGMKIEATNESGKDLRMFFYDVDYTLGDKHGDDVLYFHAHWRRENPTTMQRDYEILPQVIGRGRYLGTNIGVIANTELYFHSWWGEGEVKVYLDGDDKFPTLCGTGTEDYIGTSWGQGQYANLYQGCHIADREKLCYGFYRLHVPDPVYFHKDCRVTIQQIGCWNPQAKKQMHESGRDYYAAGEGLKKLNLSPEGKTNDYGLFERQDDWSSCAYFYLDKPASSLPPLAQVGQRVAGLK